VTRRRKEEAATEPAAADRPASRAPAAAQPSAAGPANPRAGAPERIELPPSGLAAEILAQLGGPAPGGAQEAAGRDRVYSFADALARRGREVEEPREHPESWVLFALAGETYGLPVSAVQEILRAGTITRVPHAPAPVRGITHLRGRVLAVVDLRVRLGLPPALVDGKSRILVVDSRQRVLGLLVDAAQQVVKLLPSAFVPPPVDVMTERSHYLRGVVHLERQLIIALDLDRVLLIQDEDLAPGAPGEPDEKPPED
jgi:purine-binding chemotaxis protein CheW